MRASGDATCGVGSAAGACNVAGGGVCAALTSNAKTTTHPALTIVDLAAGVGTTTALDATFTTAADLTINPAVASTRMPLLPVDIDFKNNAFAYVAAEGADALFQADDHDRHDHEGRVSRQRLHRPPDVCRRDRPVADRRRRQPRTQAFAFVANDGDRNVEAIDLNAQAVAVGPSGTDFRVLASSALPTAGSAQASELNGKRFFNTGLGRWSLNGAAWGSCGSCHVDGLSDNVTWYFARGPRQTVSLDGTFNSADPTDQRILNWTGIFDEVADFESNVRGISGGVGAIVSTVSSPPVNSDRINLFTHHPGCAAGARRLQRRRREPREHQRHERSQRDRQLGRHQQLDRQPPLPASRDQPRRGRRDGRPGDLRRPRAGKLHRLPQRRQVDRSRGVFYTPGDVPNDAFGSSATTSLSQDDVPPARRSMASRRRCSRARWRPRASRRCDQARLRRSSSCSASFAPWGRSRRTALSRLASRPPR